jgi:hypothetical protein
LLLTLLRIQSILIVMHLRTRATKQNKFSTDI